MLRTSVSSAIYSELPSDLEDELYDIMYTSFKFGTELAKAVQKLKTTHRVFPPNLGGFESLVGTFGVTTQNQFSKMPVEKDVVSSPTAAKQPRTDRGDEYDVPVLKFAKITPDAFTPTRGSKHAAGYDLYSAHEYTVPARGKILAKTDIQIALPNKCYGRVAPRSGLALKHSIDVGAGVIDEDYRGNVGVILFNHSDEVFHVAKGDRIAQLICERIFYPQLDECTSLDETERGSNGFGSTGKK